MSRYSAIEVEVESDPTPTQVIHRDAAAPAATDQPEIVQVFLDWLHDASPAQVQSAAPLVLDAMIERGVNVVALGAERILGLLHYRGSAPLPRRRSPL